MTPESLSREGSPTPDSYPDSTISSPVIHGTHLEVKTSQSAPGSPGHPGKKRSWQCICESLHKERNAHFPYPHLHNVIKYSLDIACDLFILSRTRGGVTDNSMWFGLVTGFIH
jgi:hypothetical protein